MASGFISLAGKEPDLTVAAAAPAPDFGSTALLPAPTVSGTQELDPDELELRRQRRIVIYVRTQPRQAVASIELLSPSNKAAATIGQCVTWKNARWRCMEACTGSRSICCAVAERPPLAVMLPQPADYLAYVAQATPTGWNHLVYAWGLRDPLPPLPIPLLDAEQVRLDLGVCFRAAYDRIAADDEADYAELPPPPPLRRRPHLGRGAASPARLAALKGVKPSIGVFSNSRVVLPPRSAV